MKESKSTSSPGGLLLRVVVAVLASILIPVITGVYLTGPHGEPLLSGFDQFILGVLTFLVIEIIDISWVIKNLSEADREANLWFETRAPIENILANIRSSYSKILERASPETNLFSLYFARIFSTLDDNVYEAATKQELKVEEHIFAATDLVLSICERGGIDVLRLVHILDVEPNNFSFKIWWKKYYRELTRLAANETLTIRRLFIYDEESQLTTAAFRLLFNFHARNPGYDYRIIHRSDWDALMTARNLPTWESDFGVWGNAFIWITTKASPDRIAGVYNTQPRTLEVYTDMFDAAWNLTVAPEPSPGQYVTVYELFEGSPPPPHLLAQELAIFPKAHKRSFRANNAGRDHARGVPGIEEAADDKLCGNL